MTFHNKSPRLLTAGYLTLDMIVRDLPTGDFWHSAGGTCGNVSIFSAALGIDVSLLARIGKDCRGSRVLDLITAAGINTAGIEHSAHVRTPGIVEFIHGTPNGNHRFTHQCPLCESRLPKLATVSRRQATASAKAISNFDAFFFDRATSSTIQLATAAREAGLIVMFEPPSLPRTERAIQAAELSDIVKVSRRPSTPAHSWMLNPESTTKFIIETLGPEGARFCTSVRGRSTNWEQLPPFPTENVRDTAGAGDWLSAGLLAYLLANKTDIDCNSLRESIRFGQRLSSISIKYDGPHGALDELVRSGTRKPASPDSDTSSRHQHCVQSSAYSTPVPGCHQNRCDLCLTHYEPETPTSAGSTK